MDEFIKIAITNFPNFAGFALLAYALWRVNTSLQVMLNQQIERYDRLVKVLLETERLSPQQVSRIFDRVNHDT